MRDSILLANTEGSRVIQPDVGNHVTRMNGEVLPTLLVDGHVAGVRRPVQGRYGGRLSWRVLGAVPWGVVTGCGEPVQCARRGTFTWPGLTALSAA